MRDRLEKRLSELSTEFESGQRMLAELEARQANMRTTLLRISGAIQVLKEVIEQDGQEENESPRVETTEALHPEKEAAPMAAL